MCWFHKWEYSNLTKFSPVMWYGVESSEPEVLWRYSTRTCVKCGKIEKTHDIINWTCIKQGDNNLNQR